MGYSVTYSRAAEKYLDSQTQSTKKRIMDADVVTIAPRGDVYKK